MDNLFLKFQGFNPSDFARSLLKDKMHALQEKAPYGSNLNATFSRRDHLFKGVVTIYSSAGRFFAVASGADLREVTQKLIDQLKKQIDRWKSQRFQRTGIKDITAHFLSSQELSHDSNSVA